MTDDDRDHTEESATASAKEELVTALTHLKKAGELLFSAADPALRRAAEQAEKTLDKTREGVEPIAQKVSSELEKLTRNLASTLESRVKSRSRPANESSEIERLEHEAENPDSKRR